MASIYGNMKNFLKLLICAGFVPAVLLGGCGDAPTDLHKQNREIEALEENLEIHRIRKEKEKALELDKKLGYITGTVFVKEIGGYSDTAVWGLSGEYKGKMGGGAIFPLGLVLGGSNGSIRSEYNSSGYTPYFVGINTDDRRVIGLHITDANDKKAGALLLVINEGSRIRFPAGNLKSTKGRSVKYYLEETCFNEKTQIGTKRADRIEILYEE